MAKPNYSVNFDDPRLLHAIDTFDIYAFLDDCNVNYSMEGKNIGDSFIGIEYCPACGKDNFHFGIHKEEKFGSCLVCKAYYSPLRIVATFKGMRLKRAFDFLIEDSEYELDINDRVKGILNHRKEDKRESFRGIDPLPDNIPITRKIIDRNSTLKNFLRERRIRFYEILKHDLRLGINEHKDKIIFPVYVGGNIVSYQWRRIKFKQYFVPPNLPRYLLWEDEIVHNKTTIIVEGFLDALHLRSFTDIFSPNKYSITTGFVKALSSYQENILIEKSPLSLICMLDSKSWYEYFRRFKNRFPFDVDYVVLPNVQGKEADPSSLTFPQLKKVFEEQLNGRS